MKNINITIIGVKAHLTPVKGFLLRRGVNNNLFSDAEVKNSSKELKLWEAIKID